MNRRIAAWIGVICLILLPGCGGWLQSIPKDTVMIRPLPEERKSEEAAYEGVLSQEAVKTLSLEAVSRYYEVQLTMDELQFELSVIDSNKLEGLLSAPQEARRQNLDMKMEIDHLPVGLYFVTLTRTAAEQFAIYELVLSAADGDVLRIDREERIASVPLPTERKDVLEIVERFIREKEEGFLNDMEVNAKMSRWGTETTLFYTNNDQTALKYSVTVNTVTNRVTGFSKDVMALLRYYAII